MYSIDMNPLLLFLYNIKKCLCKDVPDCPFKCIGRKQQSYCLSICYNISLYDRFFITTQLFVDTTFLRLSCCLFLVYVSFESMYAFVPVYYIVYICIVHCAFSCMKTKTLTEPSIDKTYYF